MDPIHNSYSFSVRKEKARNVVKFLDVFEAENRTTLKALRESPEVTNTLRVFLWVLFYDFGLKPHEIASIMSVEVTRVLSIITETNEILTAGDGSLFEYIMDTKTLASIIIGE